VTTDHSWRLNVAMERTVNGDDETAVRQALYIPDEEMLAWQEVKVNLRPEEMPGKPKRVVCLRGVRRKGVRRQGHNDGKRAGVQGVLVGQLLHGELKHQTQMTKNLTCDPAAVTDGRDCGPANLQSATSRAAQTPEGTGGGATNQSVNSAEPRALWSWRPWRLHCA